MNLAPIFADQQIPDDATVTPGIEGFITFFVLAILVVLLVLSMSKHLRRVDLRAAEDELEEEERRAAEEAADTADDGAPSSETEPADISPESGDRGRDET